MNVQSFAVVMVIFKMEFVNVTKDGKVASVKYQNMSARFWIVTETEGVSMENVCVIVGSGDLTVD